MDGNPAGRLVSIMVLEGAAVVDGKRRRFDGIHITDKTRFCWTSMIWPPSLSMKDRNRPKKSCIKESGADLSCAPVWETMEEGSVFPDYALLGFYDDGSGTIL